MTGNTLVKKNVFANYLGTSAMILAPLLALPYYASILGTTQFGLISFVATLQAFLGLLDSGFSQVLIREFSLEKNESEDLRYKAAIIFFGFERIYWLAAIFTGLALVFFSAQISSKWLVLADDAIPLGALAVYGAAAIFIAQFPGALYRSVLTATQEQALLNYIVVIGVLIRHGGGLLLLLQWPSLYTYLIWQGLITFIETLVRAKYAWAAMKIDKQCLTWNFQILRPILSVASKMSLAVLMGALTVQMDRIVLSKMVPIDLFGLYVIASTVSQGVLSFITPLVQAFLPRIMQARDDYSKLIDLNVNLTKLIALVILVSGMCYSFFGEWFLKIWLRDTKTVSVVYELLSILLIGSVLNAFYHVGYFNWLAHRKTVCIFFVNGLSLAVCILFMPLFIDRWGMVGATFVFVIMNLLGLLVSLEWIFKSRFPYSK